MAISNPLDLLNLQALKANLIAVLATETAYQVANGPKPDYQLDGEQWQWTEWRQLMIEKIADLNNLIQLEAGSYQVKSYVQG